MSDLISLLRMRRLDSRNCDEEAKERLMVQAADEIERLRADAKRYRWLREHDRSVYAAYTGAALDIAVEVDMSVFDEAPR